MNTRKGDLNVNHDIDPQNPNATHFICDVLAESDFAPFLISVRRKTGDLSNAETSAAKIIITDNGPGLLRVEIPLSEVALPGAVAHRFVEGSVALSNGQEIRGRMDQAYGDDASVEVSVSGV